MRAANLVIRFLLELCLLAALAYAGLRVHVLLAVGAPLAAAVVWGVFVSPRARVRLTTAPWVGLQAVLFGGAVAGLFAAGHPVVAAVFAAAVTVNLALMLIWHERDTVT